MSMQKLLAALALVAGFTLPGAASAAVVVIGSISDSDHVAIDTIANIPFRYDAFVLTNVTGGAQTVTLTLDADAPLQPYLAYWTSSVLPESDWDNIYPTAAGIALSSTPGDVVNLSGIVLGAGDSIQIALSTEDYPVFAGTLGTYEFTVSTDVTAPDSLRLVQIHPQTRVPEPWTLGLVLLGLGAAARRSSRRSACR